MRSIKYHLIYDLYHFTGCLVIFMEQYRPLGRLVRQAPLRGAWLAALVGAGGAAIGGRSLTEWSLAT